LNSFSCGYYDSLYIWYQSKFEISKQDLITGLRHCFTESILNMVNIVKETAFLGCTIYYQAELLIGWTRGAYITG